MQIRRSLLAFGLCLLGLTSLPACAQVIVRGGVYGPPHAYYSPRHAYPPRPVVVYAVPPPVVVVPAPYYAPRPYYVPRPYYGSRGRGPGTRW